MTEKALRALVHLMEEEEPDFIDNWEEVIVKSYRAYYLTPRGEVKTGYFIISICPDLGLPSWRICKGIWTEDGEPVDVEEENIEMIYTNMTEEEIEQELRG